MTKLNKILSPEEIKEGERIEQTRAETTDRLKDDIQRNDALLRPDGDADVRNQEVQAGRRLHRHEIMRRLVKLNPQLRYHQSKNYPDIGGVYFAGYRHGFDNYGIESGSPEFGEWFICGMPHEIVNEFSVPLTVKDRILHPDCYWVNLDRVDGQMRGWRSILLRLLQMGLVSPAGIDKEFEITQGRSSQKWQQAVN